jgi:hypothetical protein
MHHFMLLTGGPQLLNISGKAISRGLLYEVLMYSAASAWKSISIVSSLFVCCSEPVNGRKNGRNQPENNLIDEGGVKWRIGAI